MDRTHSTALPTTRWETSRDRWASRYRPTTQEAYRRWTRRWTTWCTDHGLDPWEARRGDVEAYLAELARSGLAEATVALAYDATASLYRHLFEDDLVDRDPCARTRRPIVHSDGQRRTWLTPLEYAAFLRAARALGPDEHAVAAIGGMMGLRSAELCQLDVDSVRTVGGYSVLRFIGKGGKPASPPLPVPVLRAVLELTAARPSGPLLRTKAGTRLNTRSMVRLVARIGVAAQIGHSITPHGLRRTFVTTGLSTGISDRDMMAASRHASSKTLRIYDMSANDMDRHASHRIAGFLSGFAS